MQTAPHRYVFGSVADISAGLKGDTDFFTQTPGIGTKGAQQLLLIYEIKSGLSAISLSLDTGTENKQIFEALKGFGFWDSETRTAIKSLPR